jgi:non-ribosomal peptide synthetase component F
VAGRVEHQDVPFEHLVELLAPQRSMGRHPLFQVVLAVQNTVPAVLDLPGLPAGDPAARFDLEVTLTETSGPGGRPAGIDGQLTAAVDLFDPATAQEAADRLVRMLATVTSSPGTPVHQLAILTAAERDQILHVWNDTATTVPAATVTQLVAARAAACPDAVAIACGDTRICYAELEARASRLAHVLRAAGAGPETVAGLCLPPGTDLIIAMLATWKAGAAYLPLDPADPPARTAFMLNDSRTTLAVTTTAAAGALPEGITGGPAR